MKQSSPKISIIIPVFNEEKHILSCLKSLAKQSYKNFEIIIIDDGSVDKTLDVLSKFTIYNPSTGSTMLTTSSLRTSLQFTILEQSHQGPAIARNKAAGEAKGEILVFLDGDMVFSESFSEDLVRPIIDGNYQGTFSKEEYISNWDNVWARCWNYNQNWPHKKMIPDDYPDEGRDFRAILKSEFLRVGGFDNTGYTDTWTLGEKLGYKPHSVPGAKYFHANPDNLKEVFIQSKWSSKRPYKAGGLGQLVALLRSFLLISLVAGFFKSIKFQESRFIIFKIVYDLGTFLGILEMILKGKLTK